MKTLATCLCAAWLAAWTVPAGAQDAFTNLTLLTSVPEDDYDVSLSPDGRWIVFVSERTGDTELYAARRVPDVTEAPRLLAASPADDHSPAWSPDGKWLAWVSTREDAFGDVWVMAFPDGTPIMVSRRGPRDQSPRWPATEEGVMLLYDTVDAAGSNIVHAARPGDWTPAVYTGAPPRVAGPVPFAAHVEAMPADPAQPWVLVTDDTNGDGVFDGRDGRAAWLQTAAGWRQLTPPLAGLNTPRQFGDTLVLSVAVRDNLDVAATRAPFDLAGATNAAAARDEALRLRDAAPQDPYPPVAWLRQAYLLDPAGPVGGEAVCAAADILRAAQRPEQALAMLDFAAANAPLAPGWAAEAAWRRVVLALAIRERDALPAEAFRAQASAALADLGRLADAAGSDPTRLARIRVERARMLLALDDAAAALSEAKRVESSAAVEVRAAAALLRAQIYERLDMAGETVQAYRAIVADYPGEAAIAETAAARLVELAAPATLAPAERIAAAQPLRADALEGVRAAAGLAIGRLLAESGDVNAATSVWVSVMAGAASQPRPAARAAFALGTLLARLGDYAGAIAVYDGIAGQLRRQLFGGVPEFYRQARQRRIDESLAKGNYELQVNDSRLALATFTELAGYEPRLVEAWRGLIEAQSRAGLLDDAQQAVYEREAAAAPDDDFAQYRHGLALTYRQPIPERAVALIERAIVINGAVPYYHQTLGFVYEHFGRVRDNLAWRGAALREYQRATALLLAAGPVRPVEHGRLLLNTANAALGIGSYATAADLYEHRLRLGVGFDTPANEFLACRSAGIALFRAARPDEAVTRFEQAVALVPKVVAMGLLSGGEAAAVIDELHDRAALALLNAGRDAEAAAAFAGVAAAAGAQSLDRVRALRSRGFALHRLSRGQSGRERAATLAAAADSLRAALAILDGGKLTRRAADGQSGGGWLSLAVNVSSDAAGGGARLEFTDTQERGMIVAALSRVLEDQGDAAGAAACLREQLAGVDADGKLPAPYAATVRQVALDRLAGNLLEAGRAEEAAAVQVRAVRNARYELGKTMHVNANGLSLALAGLVELALAGGDGRIPAADLAGTWLFAEAALPAAAAASVWDVLDGALQRALELRDPATGEYRLPWGAVRARVQLARALVLERLAAGDESGLAAVRQAAQSLRAERLAADVATQADNGREGGELKRLALLAQGVVVRAAAGRGEDEAAEAALAAALARADRYGYPDLRWWLCAQAALGAAAPEPAAGRTLAELEALAPGLAPADAPVPYALIRHCEQATVAPCVASNGWEAAWALTERWRAARLKLVGGAAALPRPDDLAPEAAREWTTRAQALRADLIRAAGRLRAQPASAAAATERKTLTATAAAWRVHLDEGRAAGFAAARFADPRSTPFSDAAVLLEATPLTPAGAALVLVTPAGCGAWTGAGFATLTNAAGWADLAKQAATWFVLGDRLPAGVTNAATVVHLLTFEATLARLEQPRVAVQPEVLRWPPAGAAAPALDGLGRALAGSESLVLTKPLAAGSGDPAGWRLAELPVLFGDVLDRLPALDEVTLECATPAGADAAAALGAEECLAARLACTDVASLRINGHIWVAQTVTAAAMPDIAESLLASDAGAVEACLARDDAAGALRPLRRLLGLRRALGRPVAEIAEAAGLLARVEGRLERYEAAAAAAGQAVTALEQAGDPVALSGALSLLGSFLVDARRFAAAEQAYARAAAISLQAGDRARHAELLGRAGVAQENDGQFDKALETYERVRAIAADLGDVPLQVQQWRRQGRIWLQRQNRYLDAETAFTRAAELAAGGGLPGPALQARLDVARVRERLGLFDDAKSIATAIAAEAETAGLVTVQTDALLVRAAVEWAAADYFHAFKSQRAAQALADTAGDRALQVIGHNTGGLIAWALNDTDQAMAEFDAALQLAEQNLFRAEVASTLNNRGLVHRSRAAWAPALADFAAALAIDRAESNDWGIAYAQRNIGITHTLQGDPAAALAPLQEAIRLAAAIGDRANHAKAQVAAGDAQRLRKDDAAARAHYAAAVAAARTIPLPEVEWRALYGQALLDRAAGNAAAAQPGFAAAIDVVERLRASIRIEELQDGFLLDKQGLYDEMVDLLLDAGKPTEAFEFSERSRARNFIDLLGNQKLQVGSVKDQAKLDREAALRAKVESLEKQAGAAPAARKVELDKALQEARRQYTQFLVEMRADNPQLSSFVAVPTLTLKKLQGMLEPETRIVIYHVLPAQLVAWVVGPDSFQTVRTPVRREALAGVLGTYRRRLQAFEDVATEERMLSDWLMAPVEPLLGGARRLGIVPHRELHLMPFAGLRLGAGYVVDRYALFHAPSASVLEYTFARRPAAGKRDDKVLAIGNPDLGTRSLDLPFAEKEAGRMGWTFPNANVLTGKAATESWVSRNIGEYGIVHIASHGEYDPAMPLRSAVKLAGDGDNDGSLSAAEIFGLSLKADLVALSACQTGLGRIGSGDDIVGLNRAFVYAGTHEILSSLWRVDDVATAVLIKHFYRNLAGRDRADALRRAQIGVREQHAHPAYWAGVFLSGDWQ